MTNRELNRDAKRRNRCRNRLDSIGRSNVTKRGPKVEHEVTQADLEFARMKYNLRRANRQSDPVYPL